MAMKLTKDMSPREKAFAKRVKARRKKMHSSSFGKTATAINRAIGAAGEAAAKGFTRGADAVARGIGSHRKINTASVVKNFFGRRK